MQMKITNMWTTKPTIISLVIGSLVRKSKCTEIHQTKITSAPQSKIRLLSV